VQRGWLFWLDVVVSAEVRGVRAPRRRFGAIAAILWDLAEYVAFICNSDELDTAYTDTLGDMMLGLGGLRGRGTADDNALLGEV
jgi:hypothetical protein